MYACTYVRMYSIVNLLLMTYLPSNKAMLSTKYSAAMKRLEFCRGTLLQLDLRLFTQDFAQDLP